MHYHLISVIYYIWLGPSDLMIKIPKRHITYQESKYSEIGNGVKNAHTLLTTYSMCNLPHYVRGKQELIVQGGTAYDRTLYAQAQQQVVPLPNFTKTN